MGAWDHGPLENDSAQDWLDGFCDQLTFTLNHAFWSRYQEEGIAAAYILSELPKKVIHRLGHYIFNEAIEVVEEALTKLKDKLIKVQPPGLKPARKRVRHGKKKL